MSVIVRIVFNMTSSIFGAVLRVPTVFRGFSSYKDKLEYQDNYFNTPVEVKHFTEEYSLSKPSFNGSMVSGDCPQKNKKIESKHKAYCNVNEDLSISEVKNSNSLFNSVEEPFNNCNPYTNENRKRKKLGKYTIHSKPICSLESNNTDRSSEQKSRHPEQGSKKNGNACTNGFCKSESYFENLPFNNTHQETNGKNKCDFLERASENNNEEERCVNAKKICSCTKTQVCLTCANSDDEVEDGLLTPEELASVDGSDLDWLHQWSHQGSTLSLDNVHFQGELLTSKELASVEGTDHNWLYQVPHRGDCQNAPSCLKTTKDVFEASSTSLCRS